MPCGQFKVQQTFNSCFAAFKVQSSIVLSPINFESKETSANGSIVYGGNCTNCIQNSTEKDAMDCIHTLFLVSSFLFCHTVLTDWTLKRGSKFKV